MPLLAVFAEASLPKLFESKILPCCSLRVDEFNELDLTWALVFSVFSAFAVFFALTALFIALPAVNLPKTIV